MKSENLKTPSSIPQWRIARQELSKGGRREIHLRALLRLIPWGIGSAMDVEWFGTLEARKWKKIQQTMSYLRERVDVLARDVKYRPPRSYYRSEEFAQLFEQCLQKIGTESQKTKLEALRGALVSIVVNQPKYDFEKKNFFVQSMDMISELHIHALRVFRSRFEQPGAKAYAEVGQLYTALHIRKPSDRDYAYAVIDTLANRRFIEHDNVPQVEEGRINTLKQRFRLTHLGNEFLSFVRDGELDRECHQRSSRSRYVASG